MKKNKKYNYTFSIYLLLSHSLFSMDENKLYYSISSSEEPYVEPAKPLLFGLPDPSLAKNRHALIDAVSTYSSAENLQEATNTINELAQYPYFSIFFNNPENFIPIVHKLSEQFNISDHETCLALTIKRSQAQLVLQTKLNSLCNESKTTYTNLSLFAELITQGVDVDFTGKRGNDLLTALILAIKSDNIKMMHLLLNSKANPNIGKYDGNTPLILCIKKDDPVLVEIMLNAKADPQLPNIKKEFPLAVAIKINNKKIIELIQEAIKRNEKEKSIVKKDNKLEKN